MRLEGWLLGWYVTSRVLRGNPIEGTRQSPNLGAGFDRRSDASAGATLPVARAHVPGLGGTGNGCLILISLVWLRVVSVVCFGFCCLSLLCCVLFACLC